MKVSFIQILSCLVLWLHVLPSYGQDVNINVPIYQNKLFSNKINITTNGQLVDWSKTNNNSVRTYSGTEIDLLTAGTEITPFTSTSSQFFAAEIQRGAEKKYKIGAWYHGNWYLEANLADRRPSYFGEKGKYANYQNKIADVWQGPRNVSIGQDFYQLGATPGINNDASIGASTSVKVPGLQSTINGETNLINYKDSHKPLLGFYDLADKRVIDKQIEMALSRGLSYFGFYTGYLGTSGICSYSNTVINNFKESSYNQSQNYAFKYMISIYELSKDSADKSDVNYYDRVSSIISDQLAISNNSSILHQACLTDNDRPVLCLSPTFIDFNTAQFTAFATLLKKNIFKRFNIEPILLIVTTRGSYKNIDLSTYLAATATLNNGSTKSVFDGYIGFQHLMPQISKNENYDELTQDFYNCLNCKDGTKFGDNYASRSAKYEDGFKSVYGVEKLNDYLNQTIGGSTTKYNIPSISVNFDSRPWLPSEKLNSTINEKGHSNEYANKFFYNNTPEAFGQYLQSYKTYIDANPTSHNMLICYAWNEWGESGIIEPSVGYGYQYLDQIQGVFGVGSTNNSDPEITGFSTTYEEWVKGASWGNYSNDNDRVPGADPDNDGISNIFEYAFDTSPSSRDLYTLNSSSKIYSKDGYTSLYLKYPRDFRKNDLIYFVEYSKNLASDQYQTWDLYNETNWENNSNSFWGVDRSIDINNPIESRSIYCTSSIITNLANMCGSNPKNYPNERCWMLLNNAQQLRLAIAKANGNKLTSYYFPNSKGGSGTSLRKDFEAESLNYQEIFFYPNPVENIIYFNRKFEGKIEVMDLNGRVIIDKIINDNQLSVSILNSGIYLIRFSDNNSIKSLKFIKF